MDHFRQYSKEIERLCDHYNVQTLYVFGSVLTPAFNKDSDIDMVVAFNTMEANQYADNYFGLKFSLEDVFKRKIDLLEDHAIKNQIFKNIVLQNRKLIYASGNQD